MRWRAVHRNDAYALMLQEKGASNAMVSIFSSQRSVVERRCQRSSMSPSEWLLAQRRADGRIATNNDIATPLQASAEAVRALRGAGRADAVAAADAFIAAESYLGTEYLSRKIVSTVEAGSIPSQLIGAYLDSLAWGLHGVVSRCCEQGSSRDGASDTLEPLSYALTAVELCE